MAPVKALSKDKYSVILPTFNERKNLPIITWLLNRTFTEKYVSQPASPPVQLGHPHRRAHSLTSAHFP